MKVRWRVGYRGEMTRSKRHLDSQIDRLLTDDHDPDMGAVIVQLVDRLQEEPTSKGSNPELASTLAAEARATENVTVRARHRTHRQLPTRWRRRIMLSTFLSSLFGKLAIGAVALASTTGGLAATGNLPDPVQEWTAERLGAVGIAIPGPDEEVDATAVDVLKVIEEGNPEDGEEFGSEVANTASDEKSSDGRVIADDQAENADDQAENADDQTKNADVADDYTGSGASHRP